MDPFEDLVSCSGFDWDDGNRDKNWEKHGVSDPEAEQIFFNEPLVLQVDEPHSASEPRYYALGQTDARRKLFVVFTIRGNLVRIISARDMTRRELRRYEP